MSGEGLRAVIRPEPDYEFNEWSDEEVPVSRTWLDQCQRWINATNYSGNQQTRYDTQHLINEVRRLRDLIALMRLAPRLRHDWNNGPPQRLWLLAGYEIVIADMDPSGPVEGGWTVRKHTPIEVTRMEP